eukprot:CAMPEP_0178580042 /NCGR_PEP_ID=MMETSP0697-20121206/22408_1 /TAXON_ID=265572 /ORGANISM="Extubocellulus spinifer, Strain CCMP396" /LENGTH=128 /DNA_ID=CAMNT_0020215537 /DNA_START=9 /DNA_END=395 /DNA_ORIENTATION=-
MAVSSPLSAVAVPVLFLLAAVASSSAFSYANGRDIRSRTHLVSRIPRTSTSTRTAIDAAVLAPLRASPDDKSSDDGGLLDESVTQSPSGEIARLKAEMKAATDAGDMDRVMTIMGTLLALEGGYESEE